MKKKYCAVATNEAPFVKSFRWRPVESCLRAYAQDPGLRPCPCKAVGGAGRARFPPDGATIARDKEATLSAPRRGRRESSVSRPSFPRTEKGLRFARREEGPQKSASSVRNPGLIFPKRILKCCTIDHSVFFLL